MKRLKLLGFLAALACSQMAGAQVLRYADAVGDMYETDLSSVDSLVFTDISAESGVKGILVAPPDGSAVEYELPERFRITFSAQQLRIEDTNGETVVPLAGDAVLSILRSTAIRSVAAARLRVAGGLVQLEGLTADAPVSLYDLQGRLLAEAKADANGRVALSVAGRGACVVKSQSITAKILNR